MIARNALCRRGLALGLLLAGPGLIQAAVPEAPNIIVILADDLGYGDLGVTGSDKIRTPNLDTMAQQGALLTNFYASANVCTPSRAGLLTGRYAIRAGLANGVVETNDTHGLRVSEYTLSSAAKSRGYATAIVGKWHLGHREEFWPTRHGFDTFWGVPFSNDQDGFALYSNETQIEEPVVQDTLTERFTDAALRFIEAHHEEPFLLYLSHTAPHIPLHVSARFSGHSDAGLYGDVVETIDWSVGEILDKLRQLDLSRKTLILFTSDNGAWFEGSNGNRRKMKGGIWDGGYRVPFIACWPGHIPAGTRSNALVSNLDILPTVANLIGAQIPDAHKFDGKDVLAVLQGHEESPHEVLYFFSDEDVAALRTTRWKLIVRDFYRGKYIALDQVTNMDLIDEPYWLLFDMNDTEPERYSMARENPDVLKKLLGYWQSARSEFDPLRTVPPRKSFP